MQSANYHLAKFDSTLTGKMIFSTHNLVSDFSFNEFQLILCRNVLIYFERELQSKVFKLFDYSLENFGYLALGSKESLRFSPQVAHRSPPLNGLFDPVGQSVVRRPA